MATSGDSPAQETNAAFPSSSGSLCVCSRGRRAESGDLYVEGSERFADYRAQLLPWDTCDPMVAEYCQEIDLPSDAFAFITHLREELTKVAEQVDAAFPGDKSVEITFKGEPVLKRIKAKAVPASRIPLQEALRQEMPDRSSP